MKSPLSTLLLACSLCATLCTPQASHAQDFTLSGRVIDAATGEYILGATVIVDGASIGTATNTFGFYSLSLPSGATRLNFSFIGYETKTETIQMEGDATLDVELGTNVVAVAAAEIEADKSKR
ncbi:MAG: carboxypeptidase-like regulatory domain-containing protein, partial [Flavobacteriales bacterium]|nr:carboxypeptidase-like regulatory domain-containing protein [Flavobacteriales bacterium]